MTPVIITNLFCIALLIVGASGMVLLNSLTMKIDSMQANFENDYGIEPISVRTGLTAFLISGAGLVAFGTMIFA